jgi:RNA polymerase sigma-70 factor (sigma-E family)
MTSDGFAEFVTVRSPRLLRTAYLLTHDWAAAEDLLQTALVKAWSAWRRLDGDPEPYVRRILVNTYSSWWQRRWRGEQATGEVPESTLDDPHATVDERDRVWRALLRLPRRQRAVVVLRYFEDLPEVEIAELLGVSAGTVKSQAAKGLAKLRLDASLQPEGMPATSAAQRLASVEKKITQRRRRNIALGAAGTAVLLLLFFAGYRIITTHRPPQHPVTPAPSLSNGFPQYSRGYHLIGSATLPRGQSTLDFKGRVTSPSMAIFQRCVAPAGYEIQTEVIVGERSFHGPCLSSGTPISLGSDFQVGDPFLVHATVTIIPVSDHRPIDDFSSPVPLPAGAEYAIGVGERVEWDAFPFPSRPERLEPIANGTGCWRLRSDPADPLKSLSISGAWSGEVKLDAVMQTPGILHLSINYSEMLQLTWWDYDARRISAPWNTLVPAPGDPLTITITPEKATGEWAIEITQLRPDGSAEPCSG